MRITLRCFALVDGVDYDTTSVELLFNAANSRACAQIPIEDDNLDEDPETFDVTLVTTDPDISLAPDQAMVIINDNDGRSIPKFKLQ